MKKLIAVLIGMGFLVAVSLPAMADVTVTADIDKDKDKTVIENVTITKLVEVGVKQVVEPSSSAEAQAVENVVSQGNVVTETATCPIPPTYDENPTTGEYFVIDEGAPATPVTKGASIESGSMNSTSGIIGVNQSPGSINNQGNATSLSYSATAAPITEIDYLAEGEVRFIGGAFLHAESSADKVMGGMDIVDDTGAVVTSLGNKVDATKAVRGNVIDSALDAVTGIVGINQSSGNINNQNNATSLSAGDAIASLSEADLGLVNVGNISMELATVATDTLSNSALANAAGIIGVNQSSGCMNNQANVVAACVIVPVF